MEQDKGIVWYTRVNKRSTRHSIGQFGDGGTRQSGRMRNIWLE